jgi:predicted phosphodiesterase
VKKIAIISDIHGNLQALEAIIKDIRSKNIKEVICLGDTIAIGPNPKECIEMIFKENMKIILGNHEEYFIKGAYNFHEVGSDEQKHQEWVKSNLNEKIENKLKELPYIIKEKTQGIVFAFMHYARKNNKFVYINEKRTVEKLDEMFNNVDTDVIFYGHEHDLKQKKSDGISTYICVGSSGCSKDKNTYYTLLIIENEKYNVEKVELEYDREKFMETFNHMNYPDKDFIAKAFFGIGNDKI